MNISSFNPTYFAVRELAPKRCGELNCPEVAEIGWGRCERHCTSFTCMVCGRHHKSLYWDRWSVCSEKCEARACIEADEAQDE